MHTSVRIESRDHISRHQLAARLALWLAAGALALYLLGLSLYFAGVISFPYPMHYEDGAVVNGAQRSVQGANLYPENSSPPYIGGLYMPLYYLRNAGVLALFGPSLMAPRVLSLLSALLLAVLIYRWVGWRTSSRTAALLASGALLTFFPVANWAAATRSDVTAVLFSMAGVYVVDRYSRKRAVWLAIPLLAIAFYTKQTQIAAPIAVGIFLLATAPRLAVRFGTAYLAAITIPFVALDILTGHGLYRHIVEYPAAQPHWMWRAKQMFKTYLLNYGGYLLLAALAALAPPRAIRASLPNIYLGVSILTATSVVAEGSDFNHFMEMSAAVSLMAGLGLARVLSSGVPSLTLVAGTLLAAQLIVRVPSVIPGAHAPWLATPGPSSRGAGISEPALWAGLPSTESWETGERLVATLSSTDGPTLLELPAFATLAGRPVEMDDPYIFAALSRAGAWEQGPLVDRLRSGEIALVALTVDVRPPDVHHTRLTDEMIAAIRGNYVLSESLPYQALEGPRIYIYRPAKYGQVAVPLTPAPPPQGGEGGRRVQGAGAHSVRPPSAVGDVPDGRSGR